MSQKVTKFWSKKKSFFRNVRKKLKKIQFFLKKFPNTSPPGENKEFVSDQGGLVFGIFGYKNFFSQPKVLAK